MMHVRGEGGHAQPGDEDAPLEDAVLGAAARELLAAVAQFLDLLQVHARLNQVPRSQGPEASRLGKKVRALKMR